MPSYKVHLMTGCLLYALVIVFAHPTSIQQISFCAIVLVYSLLPDIDAKHAKIGMIVRSLLAVFALLGLLGAALFHTSLWLVAAPLILYILLMFTKHRKFIHTIRAAFLLSLPLLFLGMEAFVFGLLQYVLHLVLDRHIKF